MQPSTRQYAGAAYASSSSHVNGRSLQSQPSPVCRCSSESSIRKFTTSPGRSMIRETAYNGMKNIRHKNMRSKNLPDAEGKNTKWHQHTLLCSRRLQQSVIKQNNTHRLELLQLPLGEAKLSFRCRREPSSRNRLQELAEPMRPTTRVNARVCVVQCII